MMMITSENNPASSNAFIGQKQLEGGKETKQKGYPNCFEHACLLYMNITLGFYDK